MGAAVVESSHNRMINSIARDTLRPLGLFRKGRSRIWLDDHGWWVTVVAFESSGLGKAATLKVAAMWLWDDRPPGSVAFDLGRQPGGGINVPGAFSSYESDAQFEPEMRRIAIIAAAEVEQFRAWIRSYEDCAAACDASQTVLTVLDAAIAWGLARNERKALAALTRHDELMRGYIKRDQHADWKSELSRTQDHERLLRSERLRATLNPRRRSRNLSAAGSQPIAVGFTSRRSI
jgi:hypothetical protein